MEVHQLIKQYKKDLANQSLKNPESVKKRGERLAFAHTKILELLLEHIDNLESQVTQLQTIDVTDIDSQIHGLRNGQNKTFLLRYNYLSGTTEISLNGVTQTPHINNDYIESGGNIITFVEAPEPNAIILARYKKQNT